MTQPTSLRFIIIDDATGQTVFRGEGERHFPADKIELMAREVNFNGTDVARLDLTSFDKPGKYRLVVDGIGCSYPFEISRDAWTKAWKTQMRGLFHNRSGVELGPPYTSFIKPRDMHPDDGYPVKKTAYRAVEKGGEAWAEIPAGDTGESFPVGWGGYHDAGDWNPRRVSHMKVTMAMLEMLILFPDTYSKMKLNIPETAGVPDLLTEARFEFDCFYRMQDANGGIPYGLESKADPRDGEVSWRNSFASYRLAPDYAGSWFYAAVGARLSRLLKPYDAAASQRYLESAERAFAFGEQDYERDRAAGLMSSRPNTWVAIDERNLAALELYSTTQDEKYHDAFLNDTVLKVDNPNLSKGSSHKRRRRWCMRGTTHLT